MTHPVQEMFHMEVRNERGIALPIVIFTMVIIGAIVAGTFFLARQEARTGDNTIASATASEAAEAGIAQVIANWSPSAYNGIAVGDSLVLTTTSLGGNASYTPTLSRLSPQIFLVRAVGRYQANGVPPRSQRQVGMLARLDIPAVNMTSAITVRTGITISGSSEVSGRDSVPAAWGASCPPAGPMMPGIRDSSGNVNTSGACSGASCITGNPQILVDPTITSAAFTQFGSVTFAQLAASANKTVSGTMNSIAPTTTGYAGGLPAEQYHQLG